ncbi:MAG: phosphate transport system regulatory protein PhoU [Spirochaetes bacterium RBG_16_67_19]|jgi:phosphate transport system protein|nr:MAG: phosphate transport system regulatory protein PhoU [Spirochaetes bacterium RBG_16_67_19]
MPRERFEQELKRLAGMVLELGGLAETALRDSVSALERQDLPKAQSLIEADHRINLMRFDLEHEALMVIATQQPVAGDLRALAAVFEIATELERIADYAKGIATITVSIGTGPRIAPPADLARMAELACSMLHRSLQAYYRADSRLAAAIPEEDNQVDELYEQVYRQLMGRLLVDPRDIDQALRLTWVAHNLERVADRVGNICERVVFWVTGTMEEMTDDSGPRR